MEESLDQISPILPADFFSAKIDIPFIEKKGIYQPLKKKYLLPNFSDLLVEKAFSDVYLGWNESGLVFDFEISKPFEESYFPNFRRGDSIELFIDTRDLKTSGFMTKFCHHFVILGAAVDGILAGEVTSFRTEDRHELCDREKIEVSSEFKKRSANLKIFLPESVLYGYDPKSFDRIGFAYRINSALTKAQHFFLSSKSFAIENEPSLWTTLTMVHS